MITKIIGNIEKKMAVDDSIIDPIINAYGSKNLNSYPYYHSAGTSAGITWTINNDYSITATGQNTSDSETSFCCHHYYYDKNNCAINNGTYKISGCSGGNINNSYYMEVYISGGGTFVNTDGDTEFTILQGSGIANIHLTLRVKPGYKFPEGGITFYPMIRDARIEDNTYVPYAMTNRELTLNKLTYSEKLVVIGTKMPSNESEIITNIIAWVVDNKFTGIKVIEYYGSFDGFLISAKENGTIYDITVINNGSGKIYTARFGEDKTVYGSFKFTGTIL